MEKQRKIKMLSLLLLFVSVIGLTVAFAAMSRTLTINGTTELEASKWDITMGNYLVEEDGKYRTEVVDWSAEDKGECIMCDLGTYGNARFTKQPVINGTIVSDFEIKLTKPGDRAQFAVGFANEGTIDAKVESIKLSEPVCTSPSGNTADAELVCNNLHFEAYEWNGFIYEGSKFAAGESGILFYELEYKGDTLPTAPVEISNLNVEMTFIQE